MRSKLIKLVIFSFFILSLLAILDPLLSVSWPDSPKLFAYHLGQIMGLFAAVMLFWQTILGFRFISTSLTPNWLGLNKIHRWLGVTSIILILSHPLLIGYGLSATWLSFIFIPGDIYLLYGQLALYLFLIIWVTSAIFRNRFPYRLWRYFHFATLLLVPLVLLHSFALGEHIASNPLTRLTWFMMAIVISIIYLARLAWALALFGRSPYVLVDKQSLNAETTQYIFKPLTSHPLSPKPGQFIYLKHSRLSESHPFSVSFFDKKDSSIALVVKTEGRFTKKLKTIPLRHRVYLEGPYGVFTSYLARPDSQNVFIAGGIGITPFLDHIIKKGSKPFLFYSTRRQDLAIYRQTLKNSLADRYYENITNDPKVAPSAHTLTGRLTGNRLKEILKDQFTNSLFFLCGPPPMVKALTSQLLESGVSKNQIKTERFSL